MRGLYIIILMSFLVTQSFQAQMVDGYEVKSVGINDSNNNSGVSFFKQNSILYTLLKKNKDVQDSDFYVALTDENGSIMNGDLLEGNINSYINEIDLVFTNDSKKAYFTRSYLDNNKKEHFDIYVADVTDENKFINIKTLPINYRNYSTAYPSLSSDNKTLYFASNRKESLGGFDIFKVAILENGSRYGKVINLGANVNTKNDEITPYVSKNKLYFSSNGRGGEGELDVFSINFDLKEKAKNLGSSLNGPKNDFGYIRKIHRNYGFFTSNRDGGQGQNDIYYFKVIKVAAPVVVVVDQQDVVKNKEKEIEDVQVVVVDESEIKKATKSSESIAALEIEDQKIKQRIKKQRKDRVAYKGKQRRKARKLRREKEKQLVAKVDSEIEVVEKTPLLKEEIEVKVDIDEVKEKHQNVNTIPVSVDKTTIESVKVVVEPEPKYVEEIIYSKEKKLADNVYDFQRRITYNDIMVETGKKFKKRKEFTIQEEECANSIEKLDDIHFDLDKFNIRKDARLQINKAIKIMKKCSNVNFIASSYTDSRGSSEYNIKLSQRRAVSVVAYILKNSDLSEERVKGIGYGESGIKNKCYNGVKCSRQEHQVNRRTEIEVYIFQ